MGNAKQTAKVRCLSKVVPQDVNWLWPERLPLGKLTLLAGDPGLGKSFVSLSIAAIVSSGGQWPDTGIAAETGSVILLSGEDGVADTIVPRLKAMGACLERICTLEGIEIERKEGEESADVNFDLGKHCEQLSEQLSITPDAKLVIVDPVSCYCGSADSNSQTEVRALLQKLAQVAERHQVAILLVTHLSKGGAGGKAVYRPMGSLGFAAAARVVYMVAVDPENPESRLVVLAKSNLKTASTGLAFQVQDGAVFWEDREVTVTADDLAAMELPGKRTGRHAQVKLDVIDWLLETLSDRSVLSTWLQDQARLRNISKATLDRAKAELKVESKRVGFGRDSCCWCHLASVG